MLDKVEKAHRTQTLQLIALNFNYDEKYSLQVFEKVNNAYWLKHSSLLR